MPRKSHGRALVFVLATALALVLAGTAGAGRYVVVLKSGSQAAGVRAIEAAGGKVVSVNKVGVASVTAEAGFAGALRASGAVEEVGHEAAWRLSGPSFLDFISQVPGPEMATGCAQQYQPPGGTGAGPDPLSVCQWDMRIMNASPT
ncbi:MAG: hypothetical protein ACREIV_11380, partial [Planctomycetaceae bacterium]